MERAQLRCAIVQRSPCFAVARSTLGLVSLSKHSVRVVAAIIGHRDLVVRPQGFRWIITCGCGYRSAGRQSPALAAQAGIHHLEVSISRYLASGKPWPEPTELNEISDAPIEYTIERQTHHVA